VLYVTGTTCYDITSTIKLMFDVFLREKNILLLALVDRGSQYLFSYVFISIYIPRGFYVQNKSLMKWPNRPVVTRTASMWNQSDRKTNTVLSTYWNYFGHFTSPTLFGSKIPPSFMYKHIYYVLFSWTTVPTCVHVYLLSPDTSNMKNQLLISQTLTFNK